MYDFIATARRWLALASFIGCATLPLAARASTVNYFVPFNGTGNVVVFDAAAGTGGWVGSLNQTPPPDVADPLSFVSVVLFTLDRSTQTLTGSFEFTTTDLGSSVFGELSGSTLDADILNNGGQFSLDYNITGGSGLFAGASGFGLSFLDFDPLRADNNFSEAGLLSFAVAEPAALQLVLLALAGVVALRVVRRPGAAVSC